MDIIRIYIIPTALNLQHTHHHLIDMFVSIVWLDHCSVLYYIIIVSIIHMSKAEPQPEKTRCYIWDKYVDKMLVISLLIIARDFHYKF